MSPGSLLFSPKKGGGIEGGAVWHDGGRKKKKKKKLGETALDGTDGLLAGERGKRKKGEGGRSRAARVSHQKKGKSLLSSLQLQLTRAKRQGKFRSAVLSRGKKREKKKGEDAPLLPFERTPRSTPTTITDGGKADGEKGRGGQEPAVISINCKPSTDYLSFKRKERKIFLLLFLQE